MRIIDRPASRPLAAAAAAGAAALVLDALAAAGARGPVPDDPSPDWREGPVRYILTVDEDAAYRALATDDQRRAFIEAFWRSLDPTPGTPENERRAEFWKRVSESVELYPESLPGWKTDRGKAHILMGPPDRRLRQGTQEVWIYVALPRPDAPPEVRVTFTRMSAGEYRMHAGDLVFLDPKAEAVGAPAGETFLAAPGDRSSPRMLKDRIRITEFPATEARSDYFVQTLDFKWRLHFYRGQDDETRTSLTLSLPIAQFDGSESATLGPDMSVSAVFDDPAGKRPARSLEGTMRAVGGGPGPSDRALVLQASWSLPPCLYDATLMVADRRSRRGATARGKVEVPRFGHGLALSSIVLGRLRSESDPSAAAAEGRMVTVPEPSATFSQGDRMAIAYTLYNARRRDGRASYDVEYSFFLLRDDAMRQVGKPVVQSDQSSESPAFEVTLQGWPAGQYRVRVKVTDRGTGKSATAEESFQIV